MQASTAVLDAARSLEIPEPAAETPWAAQSYDPGKGQGQRGKGKEKGDKEPPPGPVWSLMWLAGADRSSLVGCLIVQALITLPQASAPKPVSLRKPSFLYAIQYCIQYCIQHCDSYLLSFPRNKARGGE